MPHVIDALLPGGATTIGLCAKTRRSRGIRGSTTAHIWMKTKNIDKCSNNNLVQLFIISRFWLIVDFALFSYIIYVTDISKSLDLIYT